MLPFAAQAHAMLSDSNPLEKAVLSTSDFPVELSLIPESVQPDPN